MSDHEYGRTVYDDGVPIDEVEVGDRLRCDPDDSVAPAVTGVRADEGEVKIYTQRVTVNTIHRWEPIEQFHVHHPNESAETDAEKAEWADDVLPGSIDGDTTHVIEDNRAVLESRV